MATQSKPRSRIPFLPVPSQPQGGYIDQARMSIWNSANLASGSLTESHDIRPPVGATWELNFAIIQVTAFASPGAGKRVRYRIMATNDGGTTFAMLRSGKLAQGTTFVEGSHNVELAGSGSSFLMDNQKYFRLTADSDDSTGTQTVDFAAVVREVI